jgi:hypothetical protein
MKTIVSVLLITFLISCGKEDAAVTPTATVEYINLRDTVLQSNQIVFDFNKDSKPDLMFYIESVSGTPHDYGEFRVVPQIESGVLAKEATPKVLNKDDMILFENNPGYNWIDDPVILATRYYPIQLENSYWDGAWKNVQNKYLGMQLTKDNKKYSGWIRISVVNDKSRMILHDAAIRKEPGVSIAAGKTE